MAIEPQELLREKKGPSCRSKAGRDGASSKSFSQASWVKQQTIVPIYQMLEVLAVSVLPLVFVSYRLWRSHAKSFRRKSGASMRRTKYFVGAGVVAADADSTFGAVKVDDGGLRNAEILAEPPES